MANAHTVTCEMFSTDSQSTPGALSRNTVLGRPTQPVTLAIISPDGHTHVGSHTKYFPRTANARPVTHEIFPSDDHRTSGHIQNIFLGRPRYTRSLGRPMQAVTLATISPDGQLTSGHIRNIFLGRPRYARSPSTKCCCRTANAAGHINNNFSVPATHVRSHTKYFPRTCSPRTPGHTRNISLGRATHALSHTKYFPRTAYTRRSLTKYCPRTENARPVTYEIFSSDGQRPSGHIRNIFRGRPRYSGPPPRNTVLGRPTQLSHYSNNFSGRATRVRSHTKYFPRTATP